MEAVITEGMEKTPSSIDQNLQCKILICIILHVISLLCLLAVADVLGSNTGIKRRSPSVNQNLQRKF